MQMKWQYGIFGSLMMFVAILAYIIILIWLIWEFRYSGELVMLGLVIAFGVFIFGIFTFLFNYLEEVTVCDRKVEEKRKEYDQRNRK